MGSSTPPAVFVVLSEESIPRNSMLAGYGHDMDAEHAGQKVASTLDVLILYKQT